MEAQNQVIRRLEEKERILQNSLTLAEREVMLRQQALELHKRKAIESAQSANDLKLHLGKCFLYFQLLIFYVLKSSLRTVHDGI